MKLSLIYSELIAKQHLWIGNIHMILINYEIMICNRVDF